MRPALSVQQRDADPNLKSDIEIFDFFEPKIENENCDFSTKKARRCNFPMISPAKSTSQNTNFTEISWNFTGNHRIPRDRFYGKAALDQRFFTKIGIPENPWFSTNSETLSIGTYIPLRNSLFFGARSGNHKKPRKIIDFLESAKPL